MVESLAVIFIIAFNLWLLHIANKMHRVKRDTIDAYGEIGAPIKFEPPRNVSMLLELAKSAKQYNEETAIIADMKRNALKKEGLDV